MEIKSVGGSSLIMFVFSNMMNHDDNRF